MRPFTDIEITEVNDDTEDRTYSRFFFLFFFHVPVSFFFLSFLPFCSFSTNFVSFRFQGASRERVDWTHAVFTVNRQLQDTEGLKIWKLLVPPKFAIYSLVRHRDFGVRILYSY